MSSTATSGSTSFSSSSVSRPSDASPTSSRSGRSLIARTTPSRYRGWSSATKTRVRVSSELTGMFVSGHFGRDDSSPDPRERLAHLLERRVLRQEGGGPGAQGAPDEAWIPVGADHHDTRERPARDQPLAQLDAAQLRHPHVEERHRGPQLVDQSLGT